MLPENTPEIAVTGGKIFFFPSMLQLCPNQGQESLSVHVSDFLWMDLFSLDLDRLSSKADLPRQQAGTCCRRADEAFR